MKTHYSLLFATLHKVIQERVSIGLILFDGGTVLCKFSHSKINGLKLLMAKDDFKVVSESVAALEKKMRASYDMPAYSAQKIFKIPDPEFSLDYVNYLSRYKNNLVTYSQPKLIDIEVNEVNMLKLFDNLVGGQETETIAKNDTPLDKLDKQFSRQLTSHFVRNHFIGLGEVPNLLVPVKVDLAGKNGLDVFVQSIDMTKGQQQIIQEISTFYILKNTYARNNQPMQDFVLSETPPQSLKKQYAIWKSLVDSKEFNYVDVSEGHKILDYAIKHNVKPQFGDIDETNDVPW